MPVLARDLRPPDYSETIALRVQACCSGVDGTLGAVEIRERVLRLAA